LINLIVKKDTNNAHDRYFRNCPVEHSGKDPVGLSLIREIDFLLRNSREGSKKGNDIYIYHAKAQGSHREKKNNI